MNKAVAIAPILAIDKYDTNADLIVACRDLGYLHRDWLTLDPTYGNGIFWKRWTPKNLVGTDLDAHKSLTGFSVDFTALPHQARSFRAVVFDPPYKLNGTPDTELDERYGTHVSTRWQDRMTLCRRGIAECARVCDEWLLIKCQDQVCSGKIRWQTVEFNRLAEDCGFGLYDRLDFLSYRPQPTGTSQRHARRNFSTLLVLKRGWNSSDTAAKDD